MAEISLAALLNTDDFKRLEHIYLVRNDSSGTTIVKPNLIKMIELQTEGMKLRMPKNSCQKGQNLTVFIFETPMKTKIINIPLDGTLKGSFECLGKIKDLETFEKNEEIIVSLEFTQIDEVKWKEIVDKYHALEERINNISEQGRK